MSYVTLKIETDNDAFSDFPDYEIARILHDLATRLENGAYSPEGETLRDINGNKVGSYDVYGLS